MSAAEARIPADAKDFECVSCGDTKLRTSFPTVTGPADRSAQCRACRNKRQAEQPPAARRAGSGGRRRKDGRPNNDWSLIIPRAAEFAAGYTYPPSLRRVFYQLVSAGVLPNTDGDSDTLSKYSAEARRGEGRWGHFLPAGFPPLADDSRAFQGNDGFETAEAFIDDALDPDAFTMDRTRDLPATIVLGIEKHADFPYLADWFGDLGLARLEVRGYHSEPYERRVNAYLARQHRRYKRPSVLLYAGDHDASGDDILRNFLRRTSFDDHIRVALTFEQVHEEFDLPLNLGKEEDSRNDAFCDRYAYALDAPVQVELDALDHDDLRGLYARAIAAVLGPPEPEPDGVSGPPETPAGPAPTADDLLGLDVFAAVLEDEERERKKLRKVRDHWAEIEELLASIPDDEGDDDS